MPDTRTVWVAIWIASAVLVAVDLAIWLMLFLMTIPVRKFSEFVVNEGLDGVSDKIAIPMVGAVGGGIFGAAMTTVLTGTASSRDQSLGFVQAGAALCLILWAPVGISSIRRAGTPKNIEAEIFRLTKNPGPPHEVEVLRAELARQLAATLRWKGRGRLIHFALISALVLLGFSWLIVNQFVSFDRYYIVTRSLIVAALTVLAGVLREMYYRRHFRYYGYLELLVAAVPFQDVSRDVSQTDPSPVHQKEHGWGSLLLGSGLVVVALGVANLHHRQSSRRPTETGVEDRKRHGSS